MKNTLWLQVNSFFKIPLPVFFDLEDFKDLAVTGFCLKEFLAALAIVGVICKTKQTHLTFDKGMVFRYFVFIK